MIRVGILDLLAQSADETANGDAGPESTWRDEAACGTLDPAAFFVEKGHHATFAKAICQRCPVRQDCLDEAIAGRVLYGVWGGLTPIERRDLARRESA